jgi:hypothetical protein
MKSKYLLILFSVAGLMLGAQSALAASAAVREMAGIMMHLEHYPGDAEKVKLKAIAADKGNTEDERVIATAIMDIKHHVAPRDVDKLKKVIDDASAPAEVHSLASIVLNIAHRPTAADKEELSKMMQ